MIEIVASRIRITTATWTELKNVSSGGLVYNTSIAIQNTDTNAATNVTGTFVPDPVLNAAVGGTLVTNVSGGVQ